MTPVPPASQHKSGKAEEEELQTDLPDSSGQRGTPCGVPGLTASRMDTGAWGPRCTACLQNTASWPPPSPTRRCPRDVPRRGPGTLPWPLLPPPSPLPRFVCSADAKLPLPLECEHVTRAPPPRRVFMVAAGSSPSRHATFLRPLFGSTVASTRPLAGMEAAALENHLEISSLIDTALTECPSCGRHCAYTSLTYSAWNLCEALLPA